MLSKRPAEAHVDSFQKRARLSDPADEVASDFKDSLSDLSNNDRYQISTLTIIAKENTEHARAISNVLRTHIKTVPPAKKLPALYVLDSIVKNVGTPYTLFLSVDLFTTFMDAYTLVDGATRKQMESMLKTWKEPIPGSMDQTPVFPSNSTREIENALIKARTMFIEQQKAQNHLQGPPPHALPPRPHLNTPPPYMQSSQYPPYQQQQQQSQYTQQPSQPTDFQYGLPQTGYQNYQSSPPPPPQYGLQPYQQPQIRSPPQFQSPFQPPPQTHSPQPSYQYQPPQPYQPPQSAYQPPPTSGSPSQLPPNSYSLVALLQATGQYPVNASQPQPQSQPPPAQAPLQFPGLEALFKSQERLNTPNQQYPPQSFAPTPHLAPPTSNPPSLIPNSQAPYSTPPLLPASLAGLSPIKVPHAITAANDVKLTAASLKIPRPHLIRALYPNLPSSQCTTCGRRFAINTPEGKQRKTRHLDAHFRTNMRLTSALETRGTGASRSWYIDEAEWIAYRERDDADEGDEAGGTGGTLPQKGVAGSAASASAAAKATESKTKYIKAPTDATLRKLPCPICQEEFETEWNNEAQDWVWMDAVMVPPTGDGARAYHVSCLEDMARDASGR